MSDPVRGALDLEMRIDDVREAFIDYMGYGASPGMREALYRMNRN